MKNTFSTLSVLSAVILFALIFSACKKNSNPDENNKTETSDGLQKSKQATAAFTLPNAHMCGTYNWAADQPVVYPTSFNPFGVIVLSAVPGWSIEIDFQQPCAEVLKSATHSPQACNKAWNDCWNKSVDDLLAYLNNGGPTDPAILKDFLKGHVDRYLLLNYGGRFSDGNCNPNGLLSNAQFCP